MNVIRTIKNPKGKKVCEVDDKGTKIAIQFKGFLTTIIFEEDGRYKVNHKAVK